MHFQPFRPQWILDRWAARWANHLANLVFFNAVSTGRVSFPLGWGGIDPQLKGTLDFVGLNYYSTLYLKGLIPTPARPDDQVTDMGWVWHPPGIYEILSYLRDHVEQPIIVTEKRGSHYRRDFPHPVSGGASPGGPTRHG
ncbi:MAG: hypothetical protein H6555_04370 [Lewinellaceae bacterium]|nr:hypothetical protein [Lewinellaceae bacterium]